MWQKTSLLIQKKSLSAMHVSSLVKEITSSIRDDAAFLLLPPYHSLLQYHFVFGCRIVVIIVVVLVACRHGSRIMTL
jgi:hypothetical protein